MSHQEKWFADLAKAADDLGYTVERVDYRSPGQVVLRPNKYKGEITVVIEASFMDGGATVRDLLRDLTADAA